ncbi:MAG: nicotinate phosphoribosyltransferase [archaeon]|nr:nicotinate phosphoribosyltransferase [archaeon]
MAQKNNISITRDYLYFTDKYFPRTRQILEAEGINPLVRYQAFVRKPGVVNGVDEAVDFIKNVSGDKVKVYALRDGNSYDSCEPLLKIEGRVQDLVNLETVYLGIISGALTNNVNMNEVRQKARDIFNAAQGKPILYMGARHFDYSLDEEIAKICQEEEFIGCSTDIGAKAWNAKGLGTTPHALVVSYASYMDENNLAGNPTVEAAKGFDRNIDKNVSRIMLVDTFNREITDTLETARAVPNLAGVRIDTCGENYTQGSVGLELPELDVPEKYLRGKGVTIASVWGLRKILVEQGYGNLGQVVSSGFNAEKTKAFLKADKAFQEMYGFPLFTLIGTGSIANPTMATSDIVAYFNEKQGEWKEMHKVGRSEIQTSRLEKIK